MTNGQTPESTTESPNSQPFDAELFKSEIEGYLEGIRIQLQEHFQGQLENLKLDIQTTPEAVKAKPSDGEADPVQLRLKQLEEQLANYEKEKQQTLEQQRKQKYLDSLAAEVDKVQNVQFRQSVLGQLAGTYEGAKEVNGVFLSKDGKPVADVVKEWFATDYGRHHIKPEQMPTTGNRPGQEIPLGSKSTMTIQEKLSQGL